jgi:negative regulator of sigma-B (phosphoserine phosphatase)
MKLEYACQVLAREGESCCGDAVLAQVSPQGALFAVIDALGHGPTAARVAERARAALLRQPDGAAAEAVFTALNAELHGTRGAAATLFSLRGLHAEFIGAGNVLCRTYGGPMPFVPRPGIVGGLRRIHHALPVDLQAGQRLVIHSDGVSSRFDLRQVAALPPQEACAWIMRHQRHPHDDASVLIVDARLPVEVTP